MTDGGGEGPSSSLPPTAEAREHLELAHHHPGRLRVRARIFRLQEEGEAVVARVKAALEALPGITSVTHSPRTGSLLVAYEPGHAEPDAIVGLVADTAGLARPLAEAEVRERRVKPGLVAVGAAHELNQLTYELTGGRADLRTLVPAGMLGVAAYAFITQKERVPRWDNLVYWSYNIFTYLHRREIEAFGGPHREEPP